MDNGVRYVPPSSACKRLAAPPHSRSTTPPPMIYSIGNRNYMHMTHACIHITKYRWTTESDTYLLLLLVNGWLHPSVRGRPLRHRRKQKDHVRHVRVLRVRQRLEVAVLVLCKQTNKQSGTQKVHLTMKIRRTGAVLG